jgi:(E)-4-hydroxy-3-methyl-but-2-enyl pyrophosphate reductase
LKVKIAKTAGFCMGVRHAMEIVLAEANKREGRLFTFGPLIHNRQVLELLETKGVIPVEDVEGLSAEQIVVRAHGIPPQTRQKIKDMGLKVIDATCPRVARVQAIIRYHTHKGYTAVIVGDKDHAEVTGLVGYSETPAHVIQDPGDVSALPPILRPLVVAQTTQSEENFRLVVKCLKERFPNILVFDTICEATHERQKEVRALAKQVDAMVVVGGYHSGNTRRLVQVSRLEGLPTFHVETEKDLDKEKLVEMEVIGVTAGASTANWMIKNVIKELEAIRGRKETALRHMAKRGFKFLVLSNLFVATGAFALSYATSLLAGRKPGLLYPSIAFLYVYAMHVLNRFLDKGAGAYNDPERAMFHRKYKPVLMSMGIASVICALALSLSIGLLTFSTMAALSLLGIVYSIQLLPESFRRLYRYSRIKNIPGSKTVSEALAWAVVIVLVPLLEGHNTVFSTAILIFYIVISICYIRSALFDIFQVQGDLIVGAETLPIFLGEQRTLSLLKLLLLVCGVILTAAPWFGLLEPLSYGMLLPFLTLTLCLFAYERHWLLPGIRFEALVDANFILVGFVGFGWQVLSWRS